MSTGTKSSGLGTLALVGALIVGGLYYTGTSPTGFFGNLFHDKSPGINKPDDKRKDVCFEVVAFGLRRTMEIEWRTPSRNDTERPSVGKWKRCVLAHPGDEVQLIGREWSGSGRKICTIYAEEEVIGGPDETTGDDECSVRTWVTW